MSDDSVWMLAVGNVSTPALLPQHGWFSDPHLASAAASRAARNRYDQYVASYRPVVEQAEADQQRCREAFDFLTASGVTPSFTVPPDRRPPMTWNEWFQQHFADSSSDAFPYRVRLEPDVAGAALAGRIWIVGQLTGGVLRLPGSDCRRVSVSFDTAAEWSDEANRVDRRSYCAKAELIQRRNMQAVELHTARQRDAALLATAGMPVPFEVPDSPTLDVELPSYEQWRKWSKRDSAWYEPCPVDPAEAVTQP